MKDGMYSVEYKSVGGAGNGVLVLENGRVFGADFWGGKYDGEYIYDDTTRLAELRLKIAMAPNATSVLGIKHPYEWSIDVTTALDPRQESGQLNIVTAMGPEIAARYKYLRPLPEA
ncbi:MAG: hypothetical protein ACLQIQ_18770 [Beijerinckiaceae bacterium]